MNPFNHKITRATRHMALMLLASFLLVSCGGGGGTSTEAPTGTTVISGIVSDDAIAGATVTATSVDSGLVLGNATTAANGSFSLNAPTTQIGAGYTLNSSGGTMNGQTFNGNLSAIYPVTADALQANLTLLTSALAEAAQNTTQISGTTLQKHEAIKENAIARGVINPDYFLVEPGGTQMAALRNQTLRTGVSETIGAQAQIFMPSILDGCGVLNTTCKDVGFFDESLSMTFKGATVSALAKDFRGCRVIMSFNENAQSITVRFENIPSTTANSTPQFICQITGNVTLTLPPSAAQPDACLTPPKVATSIPNCVTISSGMTPSYFVDGGDGHNHRTDRNTHSSTPVRGHTVTFSRSYGAVLKASAMPSSGTAQNQWVGKNAVIFVHGYILGGGFGGDDGTWGVLPKLVTDDPSFIALNFQWKTDASYLTVAAELAKAVDYAYLSTGKKVHIVAHSFGGVLSRVMLQNLNGTTSIAAAKVATLTTVGTPHSGIVQKGDALTVEGITLPAGWGTFVLPGVLPDNWLKCGQISCYQSGLDANIAQWAKDNLVCPAGIPTCPVDQVPTRGYINARFAQKTGDVYTYPLPLGLKVMVLIGQINDTNIFNNGDQLISYYGQRFVPQSGRNALLFDSIIGGATVTEQILGLNRGVNAFPADPIGDIALTPYSKYGPVGIPAVGSSNEIVGYKHSPAIPGKPDNSEVYVPWDCNLAGPCQHDTWLNIKEFLQANVAPVSAPTVALTATPSSIANGATSTLSWTSTNSTSCTSTGGGGTGIGGTFTTPALTVTTTYTVTCTGAGGSASQSTAVTVAGAALVQFSSVPGGCVRDNVTGLMWEVKTSDGGLRDWNGTYTNYDSTMSRQGNGFTPTQADIDAPTNSVGFKNAVNATNLCGFGDWRLPTAGELQSIVNVDSVPTIDTTWFPNTKPTFYWSASPSFLLSSIAGVVNFRDGSVNTTSFGIGFSGFRGFSNPVRLVRAAQ